MTDTYAVPKGFSHVAIRVAICTSLTVAAALPLQQAHAGGYEDDFFTNGYNYCDAKLIASFWGTDTVKAKLAAGKLLYKIESGGGKKAVENILSLARLWTKCEWDDGSDYTYDDMKVLADYWGLPTPFDAKLKVGKLLTEGKRQQLKDEYKKSRSRG